MNKGCLVNLYYYLWIEIQVDLLERAHKFVSTRNFYSQAAISNILSDLTWFEFQYGISFEFDSTATIVMQWYLTYRLTAYESP